MRLQRDGELVCLGQIGEVPESQQLEEERCRAVEERATHPFRAAYQLDQPALPQPSQYAAGRHAADLLDLGPAYRLSVRDDGEGLQRGRGELGRANGELRSLDGRGVDRPSEDLVA